MDPIARPRTKSKVFSSRKDSIRDATANKKVVISADITREVLVKLPSRPAISVNPFDDSTNPFASDSCSDDTSSVASTIKKKEQTQLPPPPHQSLGVNSNPFHDDYDSSLNPFS